VEELTPFFVNLFLITMMENSDTSGTMLLFLVSIISILSLTAVGLFLLADRSSLRFKKFTYKDLKVFGSTETMAGNTKRYRNVYWSGETTYLYVELSFYNHRFGARKWRTTVNLRAYHEGSVGRRKLCVIEKDIDVSATENIVVIREGWGNKAPGAFWLPGQYIWEASIDGALVGSVRFFVVNGEGSETGNPFFDLHSIKLFEGPNQGVLEENRTYQKEFKVAATRFVWAEIKLKNLQAEPWYCELVINFFNKAGFLKGSTSELKYIEKNQEDISFTTGWGAENPGTWYTGACRMDVVFMDQRIASVYFTMSEENVEGEAIMEIFDFAMMV
jgi:hypothetical protein